MVKPKLLHNYLQSEEAYNKLFDDIVKKETDWWEQRINIHSINPTDKDLTKMRELLEKDHKGKQFTDEEVRDSHHSLFGIGAIVMSVSVQKAWEQKREATIKRWKKDARARNKQVLSKIPFDNIKCKKCHALMEYQWSMLHEEELNTVPKVLFFYRCLSECENQMIFDDGMPWISQRDNSCAICNGDRKSTLTQDNKGNKYIIFECKKCGGRQVEDLPNYS